jgi:hypothetical protein
LAERGKGQPGTTLARFEIRLIMIGILGAGGMRVDELLGDPKNIEHKMEYVVATKGMRI